jgi:hypothetical protein
MNLSEQARTEAAEYIEDVVRVDRKGDRPSAERYDEALTQATLAFERLLAVRRRASRKGKVRDT